MRALRLACLAAVVVALAGGAALATPRLALAGGCGLTVKYQSTIHAGVPYTFTISWPGNGLGDSSEIVQWWVQENPNTVMGSQAHPITLPINTAAAKYILTLTSRARRQYHIWFHVNTGNGCQETFERTVKLK
jgi:hypothetical protein